MKNIFLLLWLIFSINLIACKNKSVHSCLNNDQTYSPNTDLYAQAPSNSSVYYGGFVEIINLNGNISICDALIMPHNGTKDSLLPVNQWTGFSITTARSCIDIFDNAAVNFLLFTPDIFTINNDSSQATQDSKDYLRLPIQSDFLVELAKNRSEFLYYFQLQDQGLARLYQYEQMRRQIHQTKAMFSFTGTDNDIFKNLDIGINLTADDSRFLNTQQAHGCAPFALTDDLQSSFPIEGYHRYQNMLNQMFSDVGSGRIDQHRNQLKFNISCFVYTDLVQFDGTFVKSDETIAHLQGLSDFSHLTPGAPIFRDMLPEKNNQFSKNIAQNFDNWSLHITKAGAMDSTVMESRNKDSNTTIDNFFLPTIKEIRHHVNFTKQFWLKLAFTNSQYSVWNRKEYLNWFQKRIFTMTRLNNNHSTPFEKTGNDSQYFISKKLSIAGNIARHTDNKAVFANLSMEEIFDKIKVDHVLYFLLMGYFEDNQAASQNNQAKNPLDIFNTNAFLLYNGQPVAIYLSKNNSIIDVQNNPTAYILDLPYWKGNLPNHPSVVQDSAQDPANPVVNPASPVVNPASPVVNPASPVINPASPVVNPASPDNPTNPADSNITEVTSPTNQLVNTNICNVNPTGCTPSQVTVSTINPVNQEYHTQVINPENHQRGPINPLLCMNPTGCVENDDDDEDEDEDEDEQEDCL